MKLLQKRIGVEEELLGKQQKIATGTNATADKQAPLLQPAIEEKVDVTKEFRNYNEDTVEPRVLEHYRDMRMYQTVEFYRRMENKFSFANGNCRKLMTIEEAFVELEDYIDASDPDLDLPNKLHLLQTAEGIRKAGHPDWMQLTGLLHDMGKIMFLWGTSNDGQEGRTANGKQWSLGGDTWVLGCAMPTGDNAIILPHLNELNPDMQEKRYNSKYGMYEPHCGLDQLCFCWGHDEYMYRMLMANNNASNTLPRAALDMIRYHSAYPLHEHDAYTHLLGSGDNERLDWVRLFNQFDLYTKDGDNDIREDLADTLWPYYKGLLDKYGLGGKLKW